MYLAGKARAPHFSLHVDPRLEGSCACTACAARSSLWDRSQRCNGGATARYPRRLCGHACTRLWDGKGPANLQRRTIISRISSGAELLISMCQGTRLGTSATTSDRSRCLSVLAKIFVSPTSNAENASCTPLWSQRLLRRWLARAFCLLVTPNPPLPPTFPPSFLPGPSYPWPRAGDLINGVKACSACSACSHHMRCAIFGRWPRDMTDTVAAIGVGFPSALRHFRHTLRRKSVRRGVCRHDACACGGSVKRCCTCRPPVRDTPSSRVCRQLFHPQPPMPVSQHTTVSLPIDGARE